jgi:S-(hydroxymethyl)glutathione dehydrogenase/alcohol dehydrogenase
MAAAVLFEVGQPLRLVRGIELPDPGRGQVLVKVAYSGVCRSQLMEVYGKRGEDKFLPHLLGHEGTGRVVEVGEGVVKVKPGDRVVLGWIKGRGLDAGGPRYVWADHVVNAGGITTFNEMAIVSENRVVNLPSGVPMDIGVLFGCAIPTGAGIVTNEIRPTPGSAVAVFGLGGIGLSALMATMLYSCRKVIAVDVSEDKLAMAREFGATHLVNAAQQDPVAEILRLTDGKGTDYSIEASGLCSVIEIAFNSVKRGGGLCVFASHPEHGQRIHLDPFELICGKQIRGSWGGACRPDEDIPRLAALYLEGRLPLEKLITKRYNMDQINDALDDLEHKRVGRPLIEINPSLL